MAILIILSLGFVVLFNKILVLPSHWDEGNAIGETWRFKKYFITHRYSLEEWPLDGDDHLPMAHYLVGAALSFSGWFQARQENYFPSQSQSQSQTHPFLENPDSATAFLIGRSTMAFFALASLLLLYLILRQRFSLIISFLATMLIAFNPLFLQVAPRLFLEAPQGLFLLTSLYFLLKWAGEKNLLKDLFWAFLVGVFSSFCYLTKINGLLAIGVSLVVATIFFIKGLITTKKFLILSLTATLSFSILTTLLFPPFWQNPLKLHRKLFLWRLEITKEKQRETPHYTIFEKEKYRPLGFEPVTWGGAIIGVEEKLAMISYRLLWYFDPGRRILGFPLFVILSLSSLTALLRNIFQRLSTKKLIEADNHGFLIGAWGFFVFFCLPFCFDVRPSSPLLLASFLPGNSSFLWHGKFGAWL